MREFNNETRNYERPTEGTRYAEWIALGAIAAGSVAAIVGMANCSRTGSATGAARRVAPADTIDPSTVTAPHGDKLMGAVI